MDYSLLFVIEYNPKYAAKYPHLFKSDANGEFIKPLTPSHDHMRQLKSHNLDFSNKERKKQIS